MSRSLHAAAAAAAAHPTVRSRRKWFRRRLHRSILQWQMVAVVVEATLAAARRPLSVVAATIAAMVVDITSPNTFIRQSDSRIRRGPRRPRKPHQHPAWVVVIPTRSFRGSQEAAAALASIEAAARKLPLVISFNISARGRWAPSRPTARVTRPSSSIIIISSSNNNNSSNSRKRVTRREKRRAARVGTRAAVAVETEAGVWREELSASEASLVARIIRTSARRGAWRDCYPGKILKECKNVVLIQKWSPDLSWLYRLNSVTGGRAPMRQKSMIDLRDPPPLQLQQHHFQEQIHARHHQVPHPPVPALVRAATEHDIKHKRRSMPPLEQRPSDLDELPPLLRRQMVSTEKD